MTVRNEWHAPTLTVYGDVQELTQKTVLKTPGLADDFCNNIHTPGEGEGSAA